MEPKKHKSRERAQRKDRVSGKAGSAIPSPSDSDPLGMYTGKPTEDEMPTQDADDL